MKVLILFLLLAPRLCAQVDLPIFMRALGEVETAHRPHKVGRHGERSEWQMTRYVWRQYTSRPFIEATTRPEYAQTIARRHLKFLSERIERRTGTPATARQLAIAWNAGLGALLAPPRSTRSYAARLRNLYTDFTKLEAQ